MTFDEALAEVSARGTRAISGGDGEADTGLIDFAGDLFGPGDPGLVDDGAGGSIDPSQFGPEFPGRVDAGGGGDGGGGGVGRFASSVLGGLEKEVTASPLKAFSTALGLGGTGLNILNQSRIADQAKSNERFIKQSQARAAAAAAPAVAAGTADVNRASAGKLQPAQEAAIADWVQKRKADVRARFASMGLGNSTDIDAALAQVDQMATVARGQLLQGEEATGLQALGVGVQAGQAGAQSATQQQQLLMNILAGADQQLAKLAGAAA
jgi:hypothetical protein